MHKKLEAELVSLAHSILQMKNKDDVGALHKKAQDIAEKLSLLKFVNEYINKTSQEVETKTEIIDKIETVLVEDEKISESIEEETLIETINNLASEDEEVEDEVQEPVISEDIVFERVVEETKTAHIDELVFERAVSEEPQEQEKTDDIIFEKVVEETKIANIDEPIFESAFAQEIQEVEKTDDIVFEKVVEEAKNEEVEITEPVFEKTSEEPKIEEVLTQDEDPFVKKEMFTHEEIAEIFGTKDEMIKDEESNLASMQFSLEDELTESKTKEPDPVRTVFEKESEPKESIPPKPRSLNDVLFTNNLQVGLNDRIAFVKHLFDGSQEDFNRVLSQLNSFKSEDEAKNFINSFVKPEYNWEGKEEYEDRLLIIIERKFV